MEVSQKLSLTQRKILKFIEKYRREKGFPPAIREIAKAVGLASTSSVYSNLKTIEKKGYIKRNSTKPRSIEILLPGGGGSAGESSLENEKDRTPQGKKKVKIPSPGVKIPLKDESDKPEYKSESLALPFEEEEFSQPFSTSLEFDLEEYQEDFPEELRAIYDVPAIKRSKYVIFPQKGKVIEVEEGESLLDFSPDKENPLPSEEISDVSGEEEITANEDEEEIAVGVCEKFRDLASYPLMKGYSKDLEFFDEGNVEKIYYLPLDLAGNREGFLLRLESDSLKDAGIYKGDICIMHPLDEFVEGKILALESGGQIIVRRAFRYGNNYRLEAENRRLITLYVKNIKVLGELAGVIRCRDYLPK